MEDLIFTHIQAESQMFLRNSDGNSEIVFKVRLLCALFEDNLNIVEGSMYNQKNPEAESSCTV